MTLLGIDVGTTGCKAALFVLDGRMLAAAYREYDVQNPQPGWAELDSAAVWAAVQETIREVAGQADAGDPVQALSISSLSESVVPVTADRRILGPSLLNFDSRGEEYVPALSRRLEPERLYQINGNTLGNHYTLTKLRWIKDHQPELYERAAYFLNWTSFVAFMLGAEPAVDYSIANRTLFFDINAETWSDELLAAAGLEADRLARPVPSHTVVGTVAPHMAADLGLPPGVQIAIGAHDQCANAIGCGVLNPGQAAYGMGTYHCIAPVFTGRRAPAIMIKRGINTEHHAMPGRFLAFIYNQGGALVKWFRNTFAAAEHEQYRQMGRSIYPALLDEMPPDPSSVVVLPHFMTTGPPAFIANSSGVITGLRLETTRGDILKGIIESVAYSLKENIDNLPPTGIAIGEYRVAGGGSQSDRWVQTCADILGQPFVRPAVTEASALGAAIIAGVGCGAFASFEEGVAAMIRLGRTYEPDMRQHARYAPNYARYRQLWPLLQDYLTG